MKKYVFLVEVNEEEMGQALGNFEESNHSIDISTLPLKIEDVLECSICINVDKIMLVGRYDEEKQKCAD